MDQFARTQLLLGVDAMNKLKNSRVAVFGVGGVGGYSVEALARSGVGAVDLIDDDKVCLTNINRQIIADVISLAIYFAKGGGAYTSLNIRPYEGIVKIDRKFSGTRRAILHQRRMFVPNIEDGSIKLRIILDRYSCEIFVGDGEQTMTTTIYTEQSARDITFACDGDALMDIIKQDIIM